MEIFFGMPCCLSLWAHSWWQGDVTGLKGDVGKQLTLLCMLEIVVEVLPWDIWWMEEEINQHPAFWDGASFLCLEEENGSCSVTQEEFFLALSP